MTDQMWGDHGLTDAAAKQIVGRAWEFYQQQGGSSWVPKYMAGRGLGAVTVGHAPRGWTALVDTLREQGVTDAEMVGAGVARAGNRPDQLIDAFSDRLILPVHDVDGQVVAFVARKHPGNDDPKVPKYVNSPTTEFFKKGEVPYGLTPQALERLQDGMGVLFVEGSLDAEAVNVATAGRGVVALAPLGTALTAEQVATVDRLAPLAGRKVGVAMDNDDAGAKAAEKAYELLTDAGIETPMTVAFPDGMDAAQLLVEKGPAALNEALRAPHPLVDDVIDRKVKWWTDRTPPGQWGGAEGYLALREVAPIMAALPDEALVRQAARVAERIDFERSNVESFAFRARPYTAGRTEPLGLPIPPVLQSGGAPDRGRPQPVLPVRAKHVR